MKTSNKWLLAALLLLLGSITAYNMNLRAEYGRGAYKDPLRNMTALNFTKFNEVNVQAASQMRVKLVAGPYGVRVDNDATQFVKVSQQGSRLTIALAFPESSELLGNGRDAMLVSLPQLRKVTAGADYILEGKPATDRGRARGGVRIQGFRQDSLLVQHDYATQVVLTENELGYLRVEAGRRPGSYSVLHIEKNNRIQAADLHMQSQSELELEGRIELPRYQFGDSVRAVFSAAGLGSLHR